MSSLAKQVCKFLEEWDLDEEQLIDAVKERMDEARAMPTDAEKRKATAEVARCSRFICDWIKKYETAVFNEQVLTAPENEAFYAPYKPKEVARAGPARGGRRGGAAPAAAPARASARDTIVELDEEEMALALEIIRQRKAKAAKAQEAAAAEEAEEAEGAADDEVAAVDDMLAGAGLDDAPKKKKRGKKQ